MQEIVGHLQGLVVLGVRRHVAVVSRSAPLPLPSGMMVCTEPLPNERVPTSVARLWSCSAPATISRQAEALLALLEKNIRFNSAAGFAALNR